LLFSHAKIGARAKIGASTILRSPQFLHSEKVKNASNLWKMLATQVIATTFMYCKYKLSKSSLYLVSFCFAYFAQENKGKILH